MLLLCLFRDSPTKHAILETLTPLHNICPLQFACQFLPLYIFWPAPYIIVLFPTLFDGIDISYVIKVRGVEFKCLICIIYKKSVINARCTHSSTMFDIKSQTNRSFSSHIFYSMSHTHLWLCGLYVCNLVTFWPDAKWPAVMWFLNLLTATNRTVGRWQWSGHWMLLCSDSFIYRDRSIVFHFHSSIHVYIKLCVVGLENI